MTTPPQTPKPRGPLDDTTLAFLGWCTAQEHGKGFTTVDIAREWVDHLTDADLKGGGYRKEFLESLARLRKGEEPPLKINSPRAEGITTQMRADIWGMLAPENPDVAAEYAVLDARVFNSGNGVYAAQFIAALASMLMVDPDIPNAIDAALKEIPKECRLSSVVRDVMSWHKAQPESWETTWQVFVDKYRDRSFEKRLAAWNPEWLIETGGWPEAEVLVEYRGERNVLRTHPFNDTEPALLTTELDVPASGGKLMLRVACNVEPPDVDWMMRVRIGETVWEEPIHWINGQLR